MYFRVVVAKLTLQSGLQGEKKIKIIENKFGKMK
jgi:hypothetical protein